MLRTVSRTCSTRTHSCVPYRQIRSVPSRPAEYACETRLGVHECERSACTCVLMCEQHVCACMSARTLHVLANMCMHALSVRECTCVRVCVCVCARTGTCESTHYPCKCLWVCACTNKSGGLKSFVCTSKGGGSQCCTGTTLLPRRTCSVRAHAPGPRNGTSTSN